MIVDTKGAPSREILYAKPATTTIYSQNQFEFAETVNADPHDIPTLIRKAREIIEDQPPDQAIQEIVITLGQEGAFSVTRDRIWEAPAPPKGTESASEIGAGDTSLAERVFRTWKEETPNRAFVFGVAAGTDSVRYPGTGGGSQAGIDDLFRKIDLTEHTLKDNPYLRGNTPSASIAQADRLTVSTTSLIAAGTYAMGFIGVFLKLFYAGIPPDKALQLAHYQLNAVGQDIFGEIHDKNRVDAILGAYEGRKKGGAGSLKAGRHLGIPHPEKTVYGIVDVLEASTNIIRGFPDFGGSGGSSIYALGPLAEAFGPMPDELGAGLVIIGVPPDRPEEMNRFLASRGGEPLDPDAPVIELLRIAADVNHVTFDDLDVYLMNRSRLKEEYRKPLWAIQEQHPGLRIIEVRQGSHDQALKAILGQQDKRVPIFVGTAGSTQAVTAYLTALLFDTVAVGLRIYTRMQMEPELKKLIEVKVENALVKDSGELKSLLKEKIDHLLDIQAPYLMQIGDLSYMRADSPVWDAPKADFWKDVGGFMLKDGGICLIENIAVTLSHKNERHRGKFISENIVLNQPCLYNQRHPQEQIARLQITIQSNQWAYPYGEFYGYGHPRPWSLDFMSIGQMASSFETDPYWQMLFDESLEVTTRKVKTILDRAGAKGDSDKWLSKLRSNHWRTYGYAAELTQDAYVRYLLRKEYAESSETLLEYPELVMPNGSAKASSSGSKITTISADDEEVLFDELFIFSPDSKGRDNALFKIMKAIKTRVEKFNSPWVSTYVTEEPSRFVGEPEVFIGKYLVNASSRIREYLGGRTENRYILSFNDLLINSSKAIGKRWFQEGKSEDYQGKVKVKMVRKNNGLIIEVTDNGIGIERYILMRLFKRRLILKAILDKFRYLRNSDLWGLGIAVYNFYAKLWISELGGKIEIDTLHPKTGAHKLTYYSDSNIEVEESKRKQQGAQIRFTFPRFFTKASSAGDVANPFPLLRKGQELDISDLFLYGTSSKYSTRNLLEGGPITQPSFFRVFKESPELSKELRRRPGNISVLSRIDPKFTNTAHMVDFANIAKQISDGSIHLPLIYKPVRGVRGWGIFYIEKDEDKNIVITMAYVYDGVWSNQYTVKVGLVEEHMLEAGITNIKKDNEQKIIQFVIGSDRKDTADILLNVWKQVSGIAVSNFINYDSGVIETVAPTIKCKGKAYETRHLLKMNLLSGEGSFLKGESFARIGSSAYFSNQAISGKPELKEPQMFNPLFEMCNIKQARKAEFRRYVKRAIEEELIFFSKRLKAAGIAFDVEVKVELDLAWLPPTEKSNGFPVPFLTEWTVRLYDSNDVGTTCIIGEQNKSQAGMLAKDKKSHLLFSQAA